MVDAVRSALAQSCQSLEVIVVDDASTDSSQHKALSNLEASPEARSGRLQVIRQPANAYLGAARNLGARSARGEYLMFLDDDDILLPWAASNFLHIMRTTGADVVTATSVFFNNDEFESSDELIDIARGFRDASRHSLDYWLVVGGPTIAGMFANVFSGPVFMIRRKAFLSLRTLDGDAGFSTSREGYEDWEFHVRAHLAGLRYEKNVEPVYWYRTRGSAGMFKNLNSYIAKLHATRPYLQRYGTANSTDEMMILQRFFTGKT